MQRDSLKKSVQLHQIAAGLPGTATTEAAAEAPCRGSAPTDKATGKPEREPTICLEFAQSADDRVVQEAAEAAAARAGVHDDQGDSTAERDNSFRSSLHSLGVQTVSVATIEQQVQQQLYEQEQRLLQQDEQLRQQEQRQRQQRTQGQQSNGDDDATGDRGVTEIEEKQLVPQQRQPLQQQNLGSGELLFLNNCEDRGGEDWQTLFLTSENRRAAAECLFRQLHTGGQKKDTKAGTAATKQNEVLSERLPSDGKKPGGPPVRATFLDPANQRAHEHTQAEICSSGTDKSISSNNFSTSTTHGSGDHVASSRAQQQRSQLTDPLHSPQTLPDLTASTNLCSASEIKTLDNSVDATETAASAAEGATRDGNSTLLRGQAASFAFSSPSFTEQEKLQRNANQLTWLCKSSSKSAKNHYQPVEAAVIERGGLEDSALTATKQKPARATPPETQESDAVAFSESEEQHRKETAREKEAHKRVSAHSISVHEDGEQPKQRATPATRKKKAEIEARRKKVREEGEQTDEEEDEAISESLSLSETDGEWSPPSKVERRSRLRADHAAPTAEGKRTLATVAAKADATVKTERRRRPGLISEKVAYPSAGNGEIYRMPAAEGVFIAATERENRAVDQIRADTPGNLAAVTAASRTTEGEEESPLQLSESVSAETSGNLPLSNRGLTRRAKQDDSVLSVYTARVEEAAAAASPSWSEGGCNDVCVVNGGIVAETGEIAATAAGRAAAVREYAQAGTEQRHEQLRVPAYVWENLYCYQQDGLRWLWNLHQKGLGGVLGDEMGLGKTVQTVAFIAALHHSRILQRTWDFQRQGLARAALASTNASESDLSGTNLYRRSNRTDEACTAEAEGGDHMPGGVLLVCPATVMHQWKREFHLWYYPVRVCVFHNKSIERLKQAARAAEESNGVLLTTYETLRMHLRLLLRFVWKVVILDEGQKIRNPHSAITLAVKQVQTPHRLLLSATPIQNNLQEFWSLLDFVAPGSLGTLPVFLEQIAEPITQGGYAGASRDRVETAYRCACLLRQIALPLVLRRSKAEMQGSLQLPKKIEEVLLCHMTPQQYVLYVDFLASHKAAFRKDMPPSWRRDRASYEEKRKCRTLFALSVLRKLTNHPDLLLVHNKKRPADYGNPDRAGKLTVLREILRVWKAENRRVLLFAQTVQMLDILQLFLNGRLEQPQQSQSEICSYKFLRLDGRVPITRRHSIVDAFQRDPSYFVLLLTTRVGGVGLNLTAADRVLIVDPDWNPMTDMQARERSWRIGQQKEVCIYRLIVAGTVEEKIYQRQLFKFFLSQKILQDPRQRKFFKLNDLQEMLEPPPPPPGFDSKELTEGRFTSAEYRLLVQQGIEREEQMTLQSLHSEALYGTACSRSRAEKRMKRRRGSELEKKDVRAAQDASEEEAQSQNHERILNKQSKFQASDDSSVEDGDLAADDGLKKEKNIIIQTLLDAGGIQTSLSQDKWEEPLLDKAIVDRQSKQIAAAAIRALRSSRAERLSYGIEVPTWTGKRGRAGMPPAYCRKMGSGVHGSLPFSSYTEFDNARNTGVAESVLAGLRRLQHTVALRTHNNEERNAVDNSKRKGLKILSGRGTLKADKKFAEEPTLTFEEKHMAKKLLHFFLERADRHFAASTGELLEAFAPHVPDFKRTLFKAMLKELCVIIRGDDTTQQPSFWTLRHEFRPPPKTESASARCSLPLTSGESTEENDEVEYESVPHPAEIAAEATEEEDSTDGVESLYADI